MNSKRLNSSKVALVLILVLFLISFMTPRLIELDRFMATDEGAWLVYSGNFLYALGQREFGNTYMWYHPGVVTAWAGAAAMLVEFPDYYKLGQGYFDSYPPFEMFLEDNGVAPYDVMVTGRFIQLVFLAIVMSLILLILIELVGMVPAAVSFFLLAIDPFFIALTRMFYLDAPMAVMVLFSAVLLLLSVKSPKRRWLWLVLSGAAGGIAGLAKMPAVLIVPAVVLLLVWVEVNAVRQGEKTWTKGGRDVGVKLLVWGISAIVSVFIFWPAMWVQPVETIGGLLQAALGTTTGTMQTTRAFVEPTIFFFYNPLEQTWMNYIATLAWRTSPVILVGLAAALIAEMTGDEDWMRSGMRWASGRLLIFAILYQVFMSIAAKQSQKYILPTFLILLIIAGFGLAKIPGMLKKVWPEKWGRRIGLGLVAVGLVVQVLLMVQHIPYFWTYYNPMLGGSERAGETIFVGTGEGLDLAGEYLNQKPNADQLKVMSWYGTGCLSYFFVGEVNTPDFDNTWSQVERVKLSGSDYLLVYSNQIFRNRPEFLLEQLAGIEPEKRIWLHGIEYVRIYDVDDLPAVLKGE